MPDNSAQNQPPVGQQLPPTAQFQQVPGPHPLPPAGWQSSVPSQGPNTRGRPSWLMPTLIGAAAFVVLCCGGTIALGLAGDTGKNTESASGVSVVTPTASASEAEVPTPSSPAQVNPKPSKTPDLPLPTKAKTFGIGDKVRGGDFEFTVHKVKCGISRVGNDFLNVKAQGSYCQITVTAKNVTKKAHLFHADSTLTAQDRAGREYSPDGQAGIYGNQDAQGFLDEINPGNSVRANVYFDVPNGTKLKSVTFSAGLFTLAEDAVVSL
ncbi:DUF4352 domain-containing protein [Micromonospora sp. WMMD1102]|uniref:DUF4352 domain-containing protein n=1 Tax=Micromonospora sp. WMMD1102 TaxID=3016105 RepID=UPI002414F685|nr:DUF4352 domain-containing protein [Micromonospora sp. WMMD1102]MDG4791846.1 DUF4352 domain-containing protein [Micromonospora sp. WMMD1102]